MAWEGYRSRLCKCNDFNVYGLFGRDRQIVGDGNHSDLNATNLFYTKFSTSAASVG